MAISLGNAPEDLRVELSADGDFLSTLISCDGEWPEGVAITLKFATLSGDEVSWPATIDGDRAYWDVPAADVAEVVAANTRLVRLHYADAEGNDLLWARGNVVVS